MDKIIFNSNVHFQAKLFKTNILVILNKSLSLFPEKRDVKRKKNNVDHRRQHKKQQHNDGIYK